VTHQYAAGDFSATLVVTDSVGETNLTSVRVQTAAPTIVSEGSQVSSATTATVHGLVNANGLDTSVAFEWGRTSAVTQSSPSSDIGSGTTNVYRSYRLSGLSPGTTYYWRVIASSAAGVTTGPVKSFTA
jgi:phosphodiesterase/alkaline phosphatase D-like protein